MLKKKVGLLCWLSCSWVFAGVAWGGGTPRSYEEGEKYRIGKGVARDLQKALISYSQGCKAGHGGSCWRYAALLGWPPHQTQSGPQAEARRTKQRSYYKRACKLRYADGCVSLASILDQTGEGSKRQVAKLYSRSCRGKSGLGCYKLLEARITQVKKSPPRSLRQQKRWWKERKQRLKQIGGYLERGCRQGKEEDCFFLGYLNFQGELPKGRKYAADLFLRACHLAHANACDYLALLHGNGLGIGRDLSRARKLHQKACNLGLAEGCTNLGGMVFRGLGGPRELGQARDLFVKACRWEHGQGCLLLGEMEIRGEGGDRDVYAAFRSYKKACGLKIKEGCNRYNAMKPILEVGKAPSPRPQ